MKLQQRAAKHLKIRKKCQHDKNTINKYVYAEKYLYIERIASECGVQLTGLIRKFSDINFTPKNHFLGNMKIQHSCSFVNRTFKTIFFHVLLDLRLNKRIYTLVVIFQLLQQHPQQPSFKVAHNSFQYFPRRKF